MTKKRFIKLLMAQGKQKNEARAIALGYNSRNIPYANAYAGYCAGRAILVGFARLGAAMRSLGDSLQNTTRAFEKLRTVMEEQNNGKRTEHTEQNP